MTAPGEHQAFAIVFRVEAKPGRERELEMFLRWDCEVAAKLEPGTLRFDVLPDPRSDRAFYVYEAYEDREAFEQHKKHEPYNKWMDPSFQAEVVAKAGIEHLFEGAPIALLRRPAVATEQAVR